MPSAEGLVFVETIEPTWDNAKAIQRLTLQDVYAGGFNQPLELANPDDDQKVALQQQKLRDHPERYSGYTLNGTLVAYMKQNKWLIGDELPFVTPRLKAHLLRLMAKIRRTSETGQWGVFGLVASDELDRYQRRDALENLLKHSFRGNLRTVNIVIHANDPVLPSALHFGFVAVGKFAEAAGASGLKQRRYQRTVSK